MGKYHPVNQAHRAKEGFKYYNPASCSCMPCHSKHAWQKALYVTCFQCLKRSSIFGNRWRGEAFWRQLQWGTVDTRGQDCSLYHGMLVLPKAISASFTLDSLLPCNSRLRILISWSLLPSSTTKGHVFGGAIAFGLQANNQLIFSWWCWSSSFWWHLMLGRLLGNYM